MTATQKLKQLIIDKILGDAPVTADGVDHEFNRAMDYDGFQDVEAEVRRGTHPTDVPAPYSRYYESRSVTAQMLDGSWVGWTYWYGGGKHGEPGAVPWIEDAYDLTTYEETVVVQKFKRGT